ncbi:PAS domain-containing protein [Azospirillum sp. RWY-5-1]|uniref:histidine kinase n=1 Tax=Azospirillum oleiclasticum TaxID=2735135 RepID=A0ABX2T2U0_9PROT|nr:PAS domain-containing protein [Azospirillum oleiclasticum]NYZ11275.1 PAS domain-containing protein [Azospirillum oleiclasticum]NYZ18436.1 PAS domain-containing protein [Azospirillum oleiclasticum]
MSLLHRLVLLLGIAVLPLLAVEVRNEFELRTDRIREIHQTARHYLSLIEAEQERLVDTIRQVLATLVQTNAFRNGLEPECGGLLNRLRPSYPDYIDFFAADADGIIRCGTQREAIGVSISDRAHFREALASGNFVIGERIARRVVSGLALPFALPIRGDDGMVRGMATATLDTEWLTRFLNAKPLPPGGSFLLADRSGTVLAHAPADGMGRALLPALRQHLNAAAPGTIEVTDDASGRVHVVAFSPVGAGQEDLFMAVSIDKEAALQPIDAAMQRSIAMIGAIAGTTLLLVLWGGTRLLRRPVEALVAATERWRGGDLSARSGLDHDRSEIGTLGRAFDAMADDLQAKAVIEREVHALAHRMADVLGATTDGVFEIDADWRITFMNDRARFLIADGRDLTGRRLLDAFPEAEGTVFTERYRYAMESGEPVEFEGYFAPLDSWYSIRAFPTLGGLAVFFQDITARRAGEEALERANLEKSELLAQLNALLENAPVGFAFFDRDHRFLRVNAPMGALTGLPPRDHIGRHLREIAPIDAQAALPAIDRVFATGEAARDRELVAAGAGGDRPRHWMAGYFPVRAQGQVTAVGLMLTDITGIRQAEVERERSDMRFRSMFEQAAVGIELLDADGRLLEVNEKLCSIFGVGTGDDLLGRTWEELTDPEDVGRERPLIASLFAGTLPSYALEKRYRRRGGDRVWVRVTSSLLRGVSRESARRISIVEDITDRKGIEEALRAAKDEAERANLAKTKFLAATSHDLRQPLQSMFFFTAALANQVNTERARTALLHLERGLDAMKGLLDSLLDVSRLDAGMIVPQIEEFDVSGTIDHIAAAYGPVALGKRLRWSVDACPVVVRSDRALLERLLRNLVENALRYTEEGVVSIHCRTDGAMVRITVADTGIGIPPEQLELIFEEFHQIGNPERDRTQGLGLGLAIVRRLARLLDHPVTVRSEPGRGSEFEVSVPLGQALKAAPEESGSTPAERTGQGRIAALVDDDAIVLMGLHAILSEWGYRVISAGSADLLLDRLAEQDVRPDIVIADYRLREGRVGTEAVLRVRERFADNGLPGIILTGETGADCHIDAARHGCRVVHKPVTPRQLTAALEQHFDGRD